MDVVGLLDGFGRSLRDGRLSQRTVKAYLTDAAILMESAGIGPGYDAAAVSRIGKEEVSGYISAGGASPATQSRRRASASTLFKYCMGLAGPAGTGGLVEHNFALDVPMPDAGRDSMISVTCSEYRRMMGRLGRLSPGNFSNARDACMMGMLYEEGLRPGEVLAVRYADMAREQGNERVRVPGTRREVALAVPTLRRMGTYEGAFETRFGWPLAEEPKKPYFRNRLGQPITDKSLRRRMAEIGLEALRRHDINAMAIYNGHVRQLFDRGMTPAEVAEREGITVQTARIMAVSLGYDT